MDLALVPQEHLSPLEALLSIYAPILECLVSHLPTAGKLALSQSSRTIRQLLHSYPPFFAHLDFRLRVHESAAFDTYPPGTVYNLDSLLQSLPVDGRIVSLTLDWTAVSGYFLFNKILDRCQSTLEHLSVRGCRKVSIKHHIVPHFVYQTTILPLAGSYGVSRKPALKSLYVYKARGVRRKPFLIDRKPADGDEPSRYLTTLCQDLGIWLDLGLCPTPKLRCPRRREILRRGKEKFCVPFDKRWRVQEGNESLSQAEHTIRLKTEQSQGEDTVCWNCEAAIPDRCEACVHQMTCSSCERPLCHECSYISSVAQPAQPQTTPLPTQGLFGTTYAPPATADSTDGEQEGTVVPSPLLLPCCSTAPTSHADNLCAPCHSAMRRAACSLCEKQLCIKHELDRCRRCEGGCGRLFCFTFPDSQETGCGELESGKAQMKDCLGCDMEVCGDCRLSFVESSTSSPSPVPSEDDCSESTLSADESGRDSRGGVDLGRKTSCNCRVCQENYYCPGCWPTKPTPCESRPREIQQQKRILGNSVLLYQVAFEDPMDGKKWFTPNALLFMHRGIAETMIEEYENRQRMKALNIGPSNRGKAAAREEDLEDIATDDFELGDIRDSEIEVGENEWILERVLAIKSAGGSDGTRQLLVRNDVPSLLTSGIPIHPMDSLEAAAAAADGRDPSRDSLVLCKWLGRNMTQVTWENRSNFDGATREDRLVEAFVTMCKMEKERELERAREMERGEAGSAGMAAWDDDPEDTVLL